MTEDSQEVDVEEELKNRENRLLKIKKGYVNKQRVLVFCSRGINQKYRHLLNDLRLILPHSKSESKFDDKSNLSEINELCEMKNCNNCIFFETRKRRDLYMWIAKTPLGPSLKFHVTNVHTMEELKFTGNFLRGSRPILSFDSTFDSAPHYKLMKEVISQVFATPNKHPKSKPFIDHVLSFFISDDRIWFRCYQIADEFENGVTKQTLIEAGPRFILNPIKILSGSFDGAVLYENPNYVSPSALRELFKKKHQYTYMDRKEKAEITEQRKLEHQIPPNEFEGLFPPGETEEV